MTLPQRCRILHTCESANRIGGVQTLLQDWMDADPSSCCLGLLDMEPKSSFPLKKAGLRRTKMDTIRNIRSLARSLSVTCDTMICHNFHGLHALADLVLYNRLILYLHTNSDDVWLRLKKNHNLFDGIIASGQSLAREVRRTLSPSKIPIVAAEYPLSPRFSSVKKKKLMGPHVIGFAGRIVIEQKKPERLFSFCRHLGNMGVDYSLEIAGDGAYKHALEKELAGLPVKFLGALSQEEMLEAFGRWELQINTSDYETGPLTLLEGMAAGVIPLLPKIHCQAGDLLQTSLSECIYKKGNMEDAAGKAAQLLGRSLDELTKMRAVLTDLVRGRSVENYLHEIVYFLGRVHALPAIRGPMVFRNSWMDWLPLSIRCRLPQGPEVLF